MDIQEFIDKKHSVEEARGKETKMLGWDRSDVLYSFLGIYVLGLYAFDKESGKGKFIRKGNQIVVSGTNQKLYSNKLVVDEGLYKSSYARELNSLPMFQEFLDLYYDIGNVIPIWPGGNTHRGQFQCYDLAHIYFSNKEILFWFVKLDEKYDNAYFDEIFSGDFAKEISLFLDELTVKKYQEFLRHVCSTINKRNKLIKRHLV